MTSTRRVRRRGLKSRVAVVAIGFVRYLRGERKSSPVTSRVSFDPNSRRALHQPVRRKSSCRSATLSAGSLVAVAGDSHKLRNVANCSRVKWSVKGRLSHQVAFG